MVTEEPTTTVELGNGEVIIEVGEMASVEAVAATKPGCSVAGCIPMSARRLTVACRMRVSGVVVPRS